jgi:hypothetical protein
MTHMFIDTSTHATADFGFVCCLAHDALLQGLCRSVPYGQRNDEALGVTDLGRFEPFPASRNYLEADTACQIRWRLLHASI